MTIPLKVIRNTGEVYSPPQRKKRKTGNATSKPKGKSRTIVITDAKIASLIEKAVKAGKAIEYTHVRLPGMKLICYLSGKAMWRHRYRDANSKKQILTLGAPSVYSVSEIEAIIREQKERLELGLDPLTGHDPNSPTLDEFWKGDYRAYALQKFDSMRDRDNRYANWLQERLGSTKIVEIKKVDVVRFHTWVKEQRSGVTANRCLSLLSGVLSYAVDLELIEKNPCQGVRKFPEGDGRDRMLSESELIRFLRALVKRLDTLSGKAIFLLLVTGKRKNEILSAAWSNFDRESRTLYIPKTKNRKPETLVLNTQACELLVRMEQERDRSTDWVFPSPRSKSGHLQEVRKTMASVLKEAEITDFRTHDCRHQYGGILANSGVPMESIRKLLNHKDLRSTMIYARLTKNTLAESSEVVSDKIGEVLAHV